MNQPALDLPAKKLVPVTSIEPDAVKRLAASLSKSLEEEQAIEPRTPENLARIQVLQRNIEALEALLVREIGPAYKNSKVSVSPERSR